MNGNNFESMIKKYADELIRMSKEKSLPDIPEEVPTDEADGTPLLPSEESELFPFEEDTPQARVTTDDIPGIKETDFYEEAADELSAVTEDSLTDRATFSARVFTGNNAYPVENAKVLVVKDDRLYTFLTTDRDGITKKIPLPAYPESNSFDPESDERSVRYTGEVYATGFTPRKGLLISAVGGSDIVLDVQMTPISAEVR